MKAGQKLWTRDELILTIHLYCRMPFGQMHSRNPEVIHLAELIGRTPSSIAFKLVNFASLDPSLQARGIKGASNTSKLDREIWAEFYGNMEDLPFEAEESLANLEGTTVVDFNEIDEEDLPKEGKERERMVKTRVNQSFFRKMVLAAYDHTCCITGLSLPSLLVAGHIMKWSTHRNERMNPRNGLAMNALHDKAFENGLLAITPDYEIVVAKRLLEKGDAEVEGRLFVLYHGKEMRLPRKFLPDVRFLERHWRERFLG